PPSWRCGVWVKAGHCGLFAGSTALGVTWPTVIEWIRWRDGDGAQPARIVSARPASTAAAAPAPDDDDDDDDDDALTDDTPLGEVSFDLELAQDVVGKTAATLWE